MKANSRSTRRRISWGTVLKMCAACGAVLTAGRRRWTRTSAVINWPENYGCRPGKENPRRDAEPEEHGGNVRCGQRRHRGQFRVRRNAAHVGEVQGGEGPQGD